jgi:hypothetical protein
MCNFARSVTWQLEHTEAFGEITTSSVGEARSAPAEIVVPSIVPASTG